MERRDEPVPIKVKAAPSAGERMATVFWEREGILLLDGLPAKTTIDGDCIYRRIESCAQAIKRERRGKLSSGMLLQHDNTRPHVSSKKVSEIRELGFERLPNTPYNPDLAPGDYWLFGEMKRPLRWKRFPDFKGLNCKIK